MLTPMRNSVVAAVFVATTGTAFLLTMGGSTTVGQDPAAMAPAPRSVYNEILYVTGDDGAELHFRAGPAAESTLLNVWSRPFGSKHYLIVSHGHEFTKTTAQLNKEHSHGIRGETSEKHKSIETGNNNATNRANLIYPVPGHTHTLTIKQNETGAYMQMEHKTRYEYVQDMQVLLNGTNITQAILDHMTPDPLTGEFNLLNFSLSNEGEYLAEAWNTLSFLATDPNATDQKKGGRLEIAIFAQ